ERNISRAIYNSINTNCHSSTGASAYIQRKPPCFQSRPIVMTYRAILNVSIYIRAITKPNRIPRRPAPNTRIIIPEPKPDQVCVCVLQATRKAERDRESRITVAQNITIAVIAHSLDNVAAGITDCPWCTKVIAGDVVAVAILRKALRSMPQCVLEALLEVVIAIIGRQQRGLVQP